VDTDFPNHQWAELDLPSAATVNAVTLVWGNAVSSAYPYPVSFVIQYTYNTGYPPPYQSSPESLWVNTTAATITGTGGTQGVTFPAVSSQYFRILMTASSAGAGGGYSIAEATLYNGGTQVSVNNAASTVQTQVEVSSTDPASSLNYYTSPPGSTDFESYMTYVNSFTPHAIPLITVNFGTGTPSEAASWVYYANKVQNYGIHYWQIGNETEGAWETGGPIPTQDYVRRYIEYYNAMKAVDPTIIITGPVAGSFNDSSNMYDGNGVVQDFIGILKTKGAIADLNAIDYHWYPNYGNYSPASALASTSTLDAFPGQLNGWLTSAGVASPSTVPVLMSEFNVDPSDENFQVQLGNGLWVADALGHFINDFGSRGYCNLWDTLNGGSGNVSGGGGDLGYLSVNSGAYQYQPHATYWAMQMMTSDWAIAGDTNAHHLVSTAISGAGAPASLLAAYSDYRPDGVFSMVVVNKNPTDSYNTWITGLPFTPNATANGWTLSSTNYQWVNTGATPYHAAPDTAPTTVAFNTGGSSSFPVTFQPYSINILQFTNSGVATNTPTNTPTITVTPTVTATPNYGPATLVDDFENLSRDGTPPARTNLWGGTWSTYVDTNGSTINIQYGVSPGAAGTSYAARISGTIVAKTASNNPFAGYISYLSPVWPPTAYNLSGGGILGLEFWIYGDGNTYRVMVDNQAVTDGDNYGFNITPPTGQWTFYQEPFSAMVTQGWGTQIGLPTHPTGTDITGVQLGIEGYAISYNIEWDQIAFYTASGIATPTGTATRTATQTPTNSPTNSPTITPTPSGTWFTATPTNSPSWTPTPSSTSSFTPTWTPSATFTSTGTFTPTRTPTPTVTPNNPGILFPNPVKDGTPLSFYYDLTNPADQVKVKWFTLAFRKIYEDDTLPTAAGQWKYSLDWGQANLNPANGLYYVVLYFKTGGSEKHQVMKLLIQR
jgi:hypothetical protein